MSEVLPEYDNAIRSHARVPLSIRQTLKNKNRKTQNQTRRLINSNLRTKIKIQEYPEETFYHDLSTINSEPVFMEAIEIEQSYEEYVFEREMAQTEERAQFYLKYFRKAFDQSIEPKSKKDCFGILFHRVIGPPVVYDPSTTLQRLTWSNFVETADETNEPIFILHLTGAKRIAPSEINEYAHIFPINSK